MQRFIRFCERTGYKLKFDFTGENIIITGGSIGLGFETAKYFVSNGADIIIRSRNITLALENIDSGIYINAVVPGVLNTRMLNQVLNTGGKSYKKLLQQKENGGASIKNAAELIGYLASDISDGITGKLISAVWDDWKNFHENKNLFAKPEIFTLRRITPDLIKE